MKWLNVLFILILVVSCASFPVPNEEGLALLVVFNETGSTTEITLTGPESITFRLEQEGVNHLALSPGQYRVSLPSSESLVFNVEESAVNLFGYYFSDSGFSEMEPVIQMKSRDYIISTFDFKPWRTAPFLGFGVYTPRSPISEEAFDVLISSDQAAVEVYINDEYWGTTPVQAELVAGKHFVSLIKEGFVSQSQYLEVNGPQQTSFALESGESKEPGIKTLIVPFDNLGAGEFDYLSSIFSDTIAFSLDENPELDVEMISSDLWAGIKGKDELIQYAESNGVKILLLGTFLSNDEEILIEGELIDVRTELIKTSIIFTGEAGFSLFDSIDQMALEFVSNVNKSLPDIGKRVIEIQPTDENTANLEEKVIEKELIASRQEYDESFALGIIFGTIPNSFIINGSDVNANDGANLGVDLQYEFFLDDVISIPISFKPNLGFDDEDGELKVYFPIAAQLRANFPSLGSDIYMGLELGLILGPKVTVIEQSTSYERGPFLFINSAIDIGIKLYTHSSTEAIPEYLNLGAMLGLIGGRYDFGQSDFTVFFSEVWLYLGYGWNI
jgi:TolB-like protein